MKKRIAVIIVFILLIALTAAFFIPVNSEKKIVIHSSLLNTIKELNSPAEWQKWHPLLSAACATATACTVNTNSATRSFTIQTPQTNIKIIANGLSFDVTETTANSAASYSYNAIPSLHDDTTTIFVLKRGNLLRALLSSAKKSVETVAVDSLKSFIETPSKFYGFPIERGPVIDTNVVVIRKTFAVKDYVAGLNNMYNVIDGYITANHLTVLQPRIAHFHSLSKDSIEVMAGVAVNKIIPQSSTKSDITCMVMPSRGRAVIGYYKGSFAGRMQLYKAIDKFIQDHLLRPVAVNYEKYLDNTVPVNDSSQVEIKIYCPVI